MRAGNPKSSTGRSSSFSSGGMSITSVEQLSSHNWVAHCSSPSVEFGGAFNLRTIRFKNFARNQVGLIVPARALRNVGMLNELGLKQI
jgi:hypothetical protein